MKLTLGLIGGLSLLALPALADEAQVKAGAELYKKHCAGCHGDAGQGSKKSPPVVGKDALPLDPPATAKVRKTKFHTAADVADFVVKNMPAKKPGSLKPEEYWDILAFDLKANGVDVKEKVDENSAKKVVLHP